MDEMPSDWWPDKGVMVVAHHGEHELAFAVSQKHFELYQGNMWDETFHALRKALWKEAHVGSDRNQE